MFSKLIKILFSIRSISFLMTIFVCGVAYCENTVLCIPIYGTIEDTQEYILRRGLKYAERINAEAVIIEIDTPGGSLSTTLNMLDLLEKCKSKKIAFINNEAISAGSYLAICCDDIYFSPTGIIGSAAVVDQYGSSLGDTMSMKINSYMDAKIRALTESHPYRHSIQRAMFDSKFVLKINGKILKKADELLCLTATEACKKYGNSTLLGNGIVNNAQEIATDVFGKKMDIEHFNITGFERIAKKLSPLIPLLSAIGFLLIILELKTPGFGIFGIIGIICLCASIFAKFIAGFAGHEVLFCLLIGTTLSALDILFIGSVIISLIGFGIIIGSVWWSNIDYWPNTNLTIDMLLQPTKDFVYITIILVIFLFILWKLGLLKKGIKFLQLNKSIDTSSANNKKNLEGLVATAITPLFPSGKISIDGKIFDARCMDGIIDAGEHVTVIKRTDFEWLVKKTNGN